MSLKLYQGEATPEDRKTRATAQAGAAPPAAQPDNATLTDINIQGAQRLDTIEYIAAMARQMSSLANKCSARRLGLLLTLAAEEAEIQMGQRIRR